MKKRLWFVIVALMLCMSLFLTACGNGKSAYEIAKDNGFKGTEQQWLESLKGEKGDPGVRGTKWYYGKGDPDKSSASDAMEGDLYIDFYDGYFWSFKNGEWEALNITEEEEGISDAEELRSALENGGSIRLSNDITLDKGYNISVTEGQDVMLDLGGYTLTFDEKGSDNATRIIVKGNFTLSNGNIDFRSNAEDSQSTASSIVAEENGSIALDHVKCNFENCSGILAKKDSTINIDNSEIRSSLYCVATNAATSGYGIPKEINIIDSKLVSSNDSGDSASVLINVSTDLKIDGSTIIGDRQAVILRGCNANISNSVLGSTGKYKLDSNGNNGYENSDWKTGNEVPYAVLVIGNRGSGYQYPTVVRLTKVTLDVSARDLGDDNAESGIELKKLYRIPDVKVIDGEIMYGDGSENKNEDKNMTDNIDNDIQQPDDNTSQERKENEEGVVHPMYVYGNEDETNGVTLYMDSFTLEQAGEKFVYGGKVSLNPGVSDEISLMKARTASPARTDHKEK